MNSSVQKIKERLSIDEVVSSYIKLDRVGTNLKARCPFHNEKTPSFFISPDRGTYYCFGCGASGDIFTFVEEFEGLDFKGSLKLLADRAGVELEVYSKEQKEKESEKEKLYRAMEEATKFFENNLVKNEDVLGYLKSRGLNEKSIKDFKIGFVQNDWRLLYEKLSNQFSDLELEKAGLIKKTEKGYYDRFRGRVMFPITDSSGRVVAFSGRLFEVGLSEEALAKAGAKYLNSPETPIFSKNAVLFGIDKAKDAIRKNNFSILVEGQMDLILSHQAGYKNTVATSGTALSDSTISKENVVSNLGLVRRLSSNIVLAFDADRAGANATIRAGRIALSLGMDVKVVEMPDGVDPADLISKGGTDSWREAVKNSKHIIEFLLNKVLKNYEHDMRKAGREIKEKILPFVNALDSSIEKMYFMKKISESSGISLNAIQDDLKKIEQELKYEKEEIKEAKESLKTIYKKDYIERKLLGIILWQRTLPKPSINIEEILKQVAEILKTNGEDLIKKTKDSTEDLIFEAEVFYGPSSSSELSREGTNLDKDVNEMLLNLKEEYLKEELEKKMREMHNAEEKKDMELSVKILKEISEINNKIQDIKNGRIKKP